MGVCGWLALLPSPVSFPLSLLGGAPAYLHESLKHLAGGCGAEPRPPATVWRPKQVGVGRTPPPALAWRLQQVGRGETPKKAPGA